jgi:hypothetical protein
MFLTGFYKAGSFRINRGLFSTRNIFFNAGGGHWFCAKVRWIPRLDFLYKSSGVPKFLVFTTFLINEGRGKFADLPTKTAKATPGYLLLTTTRRIRSVSGPEIQYAR